MTHQTDLIWNQVVWCWERVGLAANPNHYSVTLWSSHPDLGEGTCNTGEDFATRAEAIAAYQALVMSPTEGIAKNGGVWAFVMIDGPDAHEITAQPDRKALKRYRRELAIDDGEWQRERAMQAGMAFGCDGYNDEMGW